MTSVTMTPTGVTLDGQLFAFPALRAACACAMCRDAGSGQNLLDPATVDPGVKPADAVGRGSPGPPAAP